MQFRVLTPGDPGPWFTQKSSSRADFSFNAAGGRYLVLCFFGRGSEPTSKGALEILTEKRELFDVSKIAFFGVSVDPRDERELSSPTPGAQFFWDFDASVSRLYGAVPSEAPANGQVSFRQLWFVLDPTMRIMAVFPFAGEESGRHEVARFLEQLPPVNAFPGFEVHAPVLVLPNVFETSFCRELVALYRQHGGEESGFMREVDGKTVSRSDPLHKRRSDYLVTEPEVISKVRARINRRVVPELLKVHHFRATRLERYLIGCYEAESGGHFSAHRDNTTKGTAHRRFAVSINLNAEFEGGELSFPEYGPRRFKPPPGCAVVFSCSLLHAVSRVTRGQRYAFLPFLFDEAAEKIRAENLSFVEMRTPGEQSAPADEA